MKPLGIKVSETVVRFQLLPELFDKFHLNWHGDIPFVVRRCQKFADSRASTVTVVASKFIHVHANEFSGELRACAASVGK
jgi:hypothetical protein